VNIDPGKSTQYKTALVHDWLTGMRGGERALEAIYELYPSPLYTLIKTKNFKSSIIDPSRVITSSIQKIPFSGRLYRKLPFLFPRAIEEFDLSGYDVILSTSHAVAKGVLTNASQLHICYMHTPMRYAWDLTFQYLREAGIEKGIIGMLARKAFHNIRTWDIISANRVDYYLTNSAYVARRIKKIYNREAEVIYGPADTDYFSLNENKDKTYVAASHMVPYKRMDIIAGAFSRMRNKKLVIIGKGPDEKKIKAIAANSPNIEMAGYLDREEFRNCLQRARALIFAAEEDFGLLPVEAQACGTPVIAFCRGGVRETIIDGRTGIFFTSQDEKSIIEAVGRFEEIEDGLDYRAIRENALRFSKSEFQRKYKNFVEDKIKNFFRDK
jgi:glycosyltransferase involved in cell wall biosynthesis